MIRFHTLDVFTDTPFAGNPLAVVLEAGALTTAQMQTIAREFNLSETIFVMAPRDPAHTARVRIFFPTAEIPFAGTPPSAAPSCWPKPPTRPATSPPRSRWRKKRALCPLPSAVRARRSRRI